MGKYKKYADELTELKNTALKEYVKAIDDEETARQRRNEAEKKRGLDTQHALRAERFREIAAEASKNLTAVKMKMQREYTAQGEKIIANGINAVKADYAAKPEQVDTATLELLKSGILNSYDMLQLMQKAEKDRNFTMIRLIAQQAQKMAKEKNFSEESARELKYIALRDRMPENNGEIYIRAFYNLDDIFRRAMRNPSLFKNWQSLSARHIDIL